MKLVTSLTLVAALAALPAAARAEDPCAADASLCENARPMPEIEAAPQTPRAGAAVSLVAKSPGRGLTFAWDLDGDGDYDDATGATAARVLGEGTPVIGVRATDDAGRAATLRQSVPVHAGNLAPSGAIDATPESARPGEPVTVKATGSDPDGKVAKVELDLDGDDAYEVSVDGPPPVSRDVTFATPGQRVLKARLTDDSGVATVTTTTLDVHAGNVAPVAWLSADFGPRLGAPLTVHAYVSDADGAVARYEFDLDGDGTYETDRGSHADAQVTFTAPGEHRVGVRVTDDDGATATTWSTIALRRSSPDARIDVAPAGGFDAQPAGASYAWDLDGDGDYDDATGAHAAIPLGTYGTVEVGLRVTAEDGGTATAHRSVELLDEPPAPPVVIFTPQQPRAGSPVTVSVEGVTNIANVQWDLDGDGVYERSGAPLAVTTTYASAGVRAVHARVTDAKTRSAAARGDVTVSPASGALAPLTVFRPSTTSALAGANVQLFGTVGGGTTTLEWDLDDDGQFDDATSGSADVSFPAPGTYEVGVRATGDGGAQASQYRTIEVHGDNRPPRGSMSVAGPVQDSIVARPGDTLSVFAAGGGDDPIAAWAWDLDEDGDFDDGTTPIGHPSFTTTGLHHARVRLTDGGGLTGIMALPVDVRADQAPTVSLLVPAVARTGVAATLRAFTGDPEFDPVTLAWDADGDGDFDDGTGTTLAFTYATAGARDIAVKASDGHGGEQIARARLLVADDAGAAPLLSFDFTGPPLPRAGRPMHVLAIAKAADGAPATLSWDLDGDGDFDDAPSSVDADDYTLTAPATRTTIAVKATDGARSSVRTFEIVPHAGNLAPRAWLDPNGSAPFPPAGLAQFGGGSQDYDGDFICCAFTYDFDTDGDGQFDDAQPGPYTKAGSYSLAMRVTDGDGGTATVARTFTLGSKPPVASFSVSGSTVTSTSTDPDGDAIASVEWDLDGNRAFDDATGASARALEGDHLVGVRVRDTTGEVGIAYAHVTGEPPPPVEHRDVPVGPAARQPLTLTVTAGRTPKLASVLKSGLSVTVRCSASCRTTVVASVNKKTAKKLHLRSRNVARGTGYGAAVKVKLTNEAKRALKRLKSVRLTLTITAVGSDGLGAAASRTLTLKR
jgi:PKD domain